MSDEERNKMALTQADSIEMVQLRKAEEYSAYVRL